MNDHLQELLAYYLERATTTHQDALLLAEHESWASCVNRLYYACFYAVTALLERHQYDTAKHTGVRSLFNQHFIHPGIVPAVYNQLFTRRHHSDYLEFYVPDAGEIRPWLGQTQDFIHFIENLLNEDFDENE